MLARFIVMAIMVTAWFFAVMVEGDGVLLPGIIGRFRVPDVPRPLELGGGDSAVAIVAMGIKVWVLVRLWLGIVPF